MKKFISVFLALCFVASFAGCSKAESNVLLPKPNTTGSESSLANDFQKHSNGGFFEDFNRVCETEEGYYFTNNEFLYYMDKATKKIIPLCNKPDCSHTYNDVKICNAYVGSANLLTYYNGKIYYVNSYSAQESNNNQVTRLFSINLDGTDRIEVQKLEESMNDNSDQDRRRAYIIHRGIIYFSLSGVIYAAPIGSDLKNAVKIYGETIEGQSGSVQHSTLNELNSSLWADGDNVYFMRHNMQVNKTYKDVLFRYNAVDQTTKQVWQVPDKKDVGDWETTGVSVTNWYITDGFIYFYLSGNDLWRSNLEDGKLERVAKISDKISVGEAVFTDDKVYILKQHGSGQGVGNGSSEHLGGESLLVYGMDGAFIKEMSLDQLNKKYSDLNVSHFAWTADNGVFITSQIYYKKQEREEAWGWRNVLTFVNDETGEITEIKDYPTAK